MLRRLFVPLAFAFLSTGHASAESEVHWSYEGESGPEHWGELAPEFASCARGEEQSPIDLSGATKAELSDIEIHWKPVTWDLVNNGHTIRLGGDDGGYAMIDGRRYDLIQFHFHAPSEHTVDGNHLAMEAHFVHRAEDGGLAVIAVMMVPGDLNLLFRNIMALAPAKPATTPFIEFDPRELLPAFSRVWRYRGSLTTPPCSEIVLWTVLRTPIEVSEADIEAFRKIMPENARPVQELNRRYLLTN
ncbi:MAG: hypothetical protein D6754_07685 [Alphaproteobacteria bacterium]|nr:MAG: hypothetical protein D6754_07685 [Alphaproteobacteria bacterium]